MMWVMFVSSGWTSLNLDSTHRIWGHRVPSNASSFSIGRDGEQATRSVPDLNLKYLQRVKGLVGPLGSDRVDTCGKDVEVSHPTTTEYIPRTVSMCPRLKSSL